MGSTHDAPSARPGRPQAASERVRGAATEHAASLECLTRDDEHAMASEQGASSCAICLVAIGPLDSCVTKCGHRFHLSCIGKALRRKGSCPICRGTLIDEDEHYDDASISVTSEFLLRTATSLSLLFATLD